LEGAEGNATPSPTDVALRNDRQAIKPGSAEDVRCNCSCIVNGYSIHFGIASLLLLE